MSNIKYHYVTVLDMACHFSISVKPLVSFAAVIRVVTQCSCPTNGCSLEFCIPFLKLTNKEQNSISWKPGPLAADLTRNMIDASANSYMHVVGSQQQKERNAELE